MCVQCLVNVHPVWLFSTVQSGVYKETTSKVSQVFLISVCWSWQIRTICNICFGEL